LATGLQIWNPAMAQIFVVAVSVACVMMCGQANANAQQSSANIFPKLTSGVENQADSTQADDSMRKPQLVDMSLFLKRHRGFTLFGQPLSNVKIDGTPAVSPAGQIPYYGGPLQNYLNTEGVYTLHDVIRPFGASGSVPLAHGRMELFGTMGGVFVPFRSAYTMPNAWLTQGTLGARVALDQAHHFWVGGTGSYLADFADKERQWGSWSADFTLQSGH
jgi:hypothetical protein